MVIKSTKENRGRLFKYLFSYLLVIPVSFIFWTFVWWIVSGFLYYCSDWAFDIRPPFVHGEQYGDYYKTYEWVVYAVWGLYVLFVPLVPLLFLRWYWGTKPTKD